MEAPERIYFSSIEDGTHYYTEAIPFEREYIEYICKDAFIEKACEFLSKLSNYNEGFIYPSHSGVIDSFVNNFKAYMKGE